MKKIFIIDHAGSKKVFFTFNAVKRYAKETIFGGMNLSQKEIKNQLSIMNLTQTSCGDFRQFQYIFQDVSIYSLHEYGIIE